MANTLSIGLDVQPLDRVRAAAVGQPIRRKLLKRRSNSRAGFDLFRPRFLVAA